MGSRVGTGAILLVVGASLVACDGTDEAERGVADESAPMTAGVIRTTVSFRTSTPCQERLLGGDPST